MEAPLASAAPPWSPRISTGKVAGLTVTLAVFGILLALVNVSINDLFTAAELVAATAILAWGSAVIRRSPPPAPRAEVKPGLPGITLFDTALVVSASVVLGSVLANLTALIVTLFALSNSPGPGPLHLSGVMTAVVNFLAQAAAYAGMALSLYVYTMDRHGISLRDLGWRRPKKWLWLIAPPFLAAAGVFIGSILQDFNQSLLPGVANGQCTAVRTGYAGVAVLAIPVVCIAAPLVEETLFRGLLYRVLRQRLGVALAILLSATIFAALHGQAVLLLPLAYFGALLALAYESSDSLVIGALTHSLFNAVGIYTLLFTNTSCGP